MSLYEKMINEAVGATKAVFGVNKANRGGTFKVTDAKPYVDAVNQMTAAEGQSKEVIALHVDSVNAHYDIMSGLCETVRPEDDPFVEHYQTPPILEIMYEEDPAFKASMWKFIDAIAENKALIGLEAARRYGGMYGPTCVVDFAMSVGSVPNVVNQILIGMDIPADHKKTILACKSWGMNTSYGLAGAFRGAVESGKTLAEAEQAEVDMLQFVYREPSAAQAHLMDTHNLGGHGPHTSFDTRKYMAQYKEQHAPDDRRRHEGRRTPRQHHRRTRLLRRRRRSPHRAVGLQHVQRRHGVRHLRGRHRRAREHAAPRPRGRTPSRACTTCSPWPPAPRPARRRTSCGRTASPSRW